MDVEHRLKLIPKKHREPSSLGIFSYDGNVLGGTLIGIGMAMTGACPGTSLVQMGSGMLNGILVVIGGVLGATAFIKLQPPLKAVRAWLRKETESSIEEGTSNAPEKPLDIATALGIHSITLLLVWVPMCLAVMGIAFVKDHSTRSIPDSGLVPPAYGGLLIGTAQLATTLFTGHAIGASAAYKDVANWIDRKFIQKSKDQSRSPLVTPSLIFSSGVVAAAATLSLVVSRGGSMQPPSPQGFDPSNAARAILGGASMVFGARLAGGCTSGHGISGLAKFSLSSLVTTTALFTAGIFAARFGA